MQASFAPASNSDNLLCSSPLPVETFSQQPCFEVEQWTKITWDFLVSEEIILSSKDICLEEADTAVGRYEQCRLEDLVLAIPNSSESKTKLSYREQPSSASISWGDDQVVRIKRKKIIQAEGIPFVIPVQPCATENQVTFGMTVVHIPFVCLSSHQVS